MKPYYEVLRELRIDNDLTQEQVAKVIKSTQGYYSKYELGIREMPISRLIDLCQFYGVSADYILGLPKNLKWPR